jgi:cyclophilin family peptidyl-prolyl cis-trans isomerase
VPSDKRSRQRLAREARAAAQEAARKRAARRRTGITLGLIVFLVVGVAALLSRGGDDTPSEEQTTGTTAASRATTTERAAAAPECPKPDGSSPRTTTFSAPPPMCIQSGDRYLADVVTSKGSFTISLDAARAPKTVNNFVFLAGHHFYDGVVFHRVIPGFVIQGGDPEGTGRGGPGYKFDDELPKAGEYKIGSVAMANSGANTNGSQFFVITGPQGAQLPPQYSLFGEVTAGMEVVQQIEALGDPSGKPKELVKMERVTVRKA